MKRICAILCLDEETNNRIQAYRDALIDKYGLPKDSIYPHITLAFYLGIDQNKIIEYTEKFVEGMKSFGIQYISVEVFSGNCVTCIVSPSSEIIELYNMYHLEYDSYCDMWTQKENKLWKPHSTIYVGSESKLEEMKSHIEVDFVPFEGKVTRFELSQINEDGFEIIYSKELEPN